MGVSASSSIDRLFGSQLVSSLYDVWFPGLGYRNVLTPDASSLIDALGAEGAMSATLLIVDVNAKRLGGTKVHFELPADREKLVALRIAAKLSA